MTSIRGSNADSNVRGQWRAYDVTIVGAGFAGRYSAWRLLSPAAQHSPPIQQLIQVLCMPRHALELLEPDTDGAHAIFQLPAFAGVDPDYVKKGKGHGH
jgi:hypothetical protein